MRNTTFALLTFVTLLALGCKHKKPRDGNSLADAIIPVDSANKMLSSYLNSIGYADNDTDLRSLSFDAAALRHYLNTPASGAEITELKVMFAHTLDYINSGNSNLSAGYGSGKLTLIIAGYDSGGNYVFPDNDHVFNKAMPCPENCPPGEAGDALLPSPAMIQ